MAVETLEALLARRTQPGTLYERLPDRRIRCYACGHRCVISEGRPGICKVRFNREGALYVPRGYVGALQCDPIEKKPFFHALPGSRALSFGMLGCDFHCSYCFLGRTRIATSKGMLPIERIVSKRLDVDVYTHAGTRRKITTFFERPYHGRILKIKPAFLPPIECTPEHPLLARRRPDRHPTDAPAYVTASQLTVDHCLALPKRYEFSEDVVLKTSTYLEPFAASYRVKSGIPNKVLARIAALTKQGCTSRHIGERVGKSASHVRHLQRRLRNPRWLDEHPVVRRARVMDEPGWVRFSREHAPGIPAMIPLDETLATLLGFYCAEGSVSRKRDRVHSATLNFSFGRTERDKALQVRRLLKRVFGVRAYLVERHTTLAVATSKTSLALFFKAMCGGRGSEKRVPEALFRARREVVQRFIDAYVAGDGYRAPDGQIRVSTISEELAWGVAWLVHKLGYLPQFYQYPQVTHRTLLGRPIKQAPWTYLVRWYETPRKQHYVWEDDDYRYALIKRIEKFEYEGPVYNLEAEEDHTYLAGFVAAHNCQNALTSQVLRDPEMVSLPEDIAAGQLVALAGKYDAPVIASTYNEPLITSEWAVEVFRLAKERGLTTAYISNGNGTPEVLEYLKPWVDLYKVDLKSFRQENYRELGGRVEVVLETIRRLHAMGFWLEIVTLVIPGFNDSDEELTQIAQFLASVSPDIPWHVTAFHKDYKMTDPDDTTAATLLRAARIGEAAGLRFVYAGNLPGQVGKYEHTFCPGCRALLIERAGYRILQDRLTPTQGRCPQCQCTIPGRWGMAHR